MFERIKKFVSNYWYYYKWYVIGGAFLLFSAVIVIIQTLGAERYDASVIWTMKGYVDTSYVKEMEKELEKYCPDIDSNGETNVRVILITFTSEDGGMPNSDVEFAMQQKLVTQLSAGDVYIVISDENTYENKLKQLAVFENIAEDYSDNERVDGEKYYLKDTIFTENEKLREVIGEDTFMLIGSEELQKLNPVDEERYAIMREVFDNIVKAG